MKIQYQDQVDSSLIERLLQAKHKAQQDNRQISSITLSDQEADEFVSLRFLADVTVRALYEGKFRLFGMTLRSSKTWPKGLHEQTNRLWL